MTTLHPFYKVLFCALMLVSFKSVSQTNPHITSVLINSCNGTCSEGDNEIIFGTTGNYSVLATPANIEVTYGTTSNPATTYTDSYINNVAKTNALNTASGCGSTLLIDAANTIIPPNSNFLITRSTICTSALNWSGLCGTGPVYILYSTDASWTTGGNFVNSTGNTRYFRSRITTTLGVQTTLQYNYTLPSAFSNDGAYASFSSTGGAASEYGDNDCNLSPVLLPSELMTFTATIENKRSVLLAWKTATEENTDRFELLHSTDGINFTLLAAIKAAGNSQTESDYLFEDIAPTAGLSYYQLQGIDIDGKQHLLGLQSAFLNVLNTYFDPFLSELHFGEEGDYAVFSTEGRLIVRANSTDKLHLDQKGMFLILNEKNGTTEKVFVN